MSNDAYRTVGGPGRSALETRGSEFLGYVRPVRSVETAAAFLEAVTLEVVAPRSEADDLRDRIRSATSGRVEFER